MSRCAILSSPAIPFMIRYWMDLFKNWEDEVDKVYFCISHLPEESALPYSKKLLNHPKIEIIENLGAFPFNLSEAIKRVKEDLICILHDDTFIYKKGVMDKYFKIAEEKVVVPFDIHYSPPEYVRSVLKYDVPEYSFFLYFLFISRENLNKTSKDFSNNKYLPGSHFFGDIDREIGGDTGFGFGLELMDKGIEFVDIPAFRPNIASHAEDPLKEMKKWDVDWLHAWSLGYLFSDMESQLHSATTPAIKESISFRLAYLEEFLDYDYTEIEDYKKKIIKNRDKLIKHHGLKMERIKQYQKWLRSLR